MLKIKTPHNQLIVRYDRSLSGILDEPLAKGVHVYTARIPNETEAEDLFRRECEKFDWKTPLSSHEKGRLENGNEWIKLGAEVYVLDQNRRVILPPMHNVKSLNANSYAAKIGNEFYYRINVLNNSILIALPNESVSPFGFAF